MTIQQLTYFVEVAETLHFTKAAQKLYITQSTLSYAISSLEHELNVPLFVRESGKRIALTSFGKELLPMAKEVLGGISSIETRMQELRSPLGGIVNVAYSYINGGRFLPKMFSDLARQPQFKDIAVNFDVNHKRTHFEDDVVRGNLDLAFSCTKATEGLEVHPFARQQLYIMLPPYHPLAERESLRVEDIAGEVLIGYDKSRNLDKWITEMFRSHGLNPNTDRYAEDWVEQLSQVSLGKGVAILPMLPFEQGTVSAVPLDDEMSVRTVYIMWAAGRKLPPTVEYVRDCCMSYYSELPLV